MATTIEALAPPRRLEYVIAIGRIDLFAESLYFLMLFVLAVLVGRLRLLRGGCPISRDLVGGAFSAGSLHHRRAEICGV